MCLDTLLQRSSLCARPPCLMLWCARWPAHDSYLFPRMLLCIHDTAHYAHLLCPPRSRIHTDTWAGRMTGSDVLETLPRPRERGPILRVGTMCACCRWQNGKHICGALRRICDGLQAGLVMLGSVTDAGSRERVRSDMFVSRSGRPRMRARECEPHRGPSAAGQESGRTLALVCTVS